MARVTHPKPAKVDQPSSPPPTSGADIVVQSLVNHGVDTIFAYPGGAVIPLHQALTRFRDKVRVILPRHEQGGGFAAQGYARSTGKIGVCMATSGPGATNLVTAIADAKFDSVPLVVITGQVGTPVIGTDAFQETPIVEVCRSVTKHHYLVTDVHDIARVMREAFHVATTGRPGPVLVDIPKNVQNMQAVPDYDAPHATARLSPRGPLRRGRADRRGGRDDSRRQAARDLCGRRRGVGRGQRRIDRARAKDGHSRDHDPDRPGLLPRRRSAFAGHARHARQRLRQLCGGQLRPAAGVGRAVRRSRDRQGVGVCQPSEDVHVDIDPSEIGKIKRPDLPIVSDVKYFLHELNKMVERPDVDEWRRKVAVWKRDEPFHYDEDFDGILSQHAISELYRLTKDRDTIITTGVGQHQMWSAQYYKFRRPRRWISSGGLGTMGFGLPAAVGAKAANPDKLVVDIDGDGSLLMNIQEMATCYCEKLPVKVMLLNNMHLGMVVQWEDRFHAPIGPTRILARSTIRKRSARATASRPNERYPDFVTIARGFHWDARHVRRKAELSRGDSGDDRLARAVSAGRASALSGARAADDPGGNDGAGFDQGVRLGRGR